jgi:chromate transport protein ChrA
LAIPILLLKMCNRSDLNEKFRRTTACVGAACAIAQWQIVVISVVLVLILLVFGGPFERAIDRRWPGRPSQPSDQPPDRTRAPGPEM